MTKPEPPPDPIRIERLTLVEEALSWLQTPFVHGQCLKGTAADCSTFPAACYRTAGIFRAEIPELPPDWFLHTTKDEYLEELARHATEYALLEHAPAPGDFVVIKDTAIGAKVFSHGAIIVAWPQVIHCFPPCVMRSNALTFPAFVGRKLKFWDPWRKPAA